MGLILSALFVFFRDMQYLWTVFAQLLMYLSAIFYTTENFSPALQTLLHLNPVYLCITYFRQIVLYGTIPPLWFHGLLLLFAAVALGIGSHIYKKFNHKFLYYL
jgi:ABC-2 type transport system permease protein